MSGRTWPHVFCSLINVKSVWPHVAARGRTCLVPKTRFKCLAARGRTCFVWGAPVTLSGWFSWQSIFLVKVVAVSYLLWVGKGTPGTVQ